MFPLLPERRTVYRWTGRTFGGHYPTTNGSLLPLLRRCFPVDLAVHYDRQCSTHSFPGSGKYWGAVQGLRCAVPIHLQRAQELRKASGRGFDGLRIDGMN